MMNSQSTASMFATVQVAQAQEATAGRYLLLLFGTVLAVLGSMVLISMIVDPLWYFSGNTLTGKNFVLDERTSKPTRLARLARKPDCLLFGTSSGSLMNDADRIAGGNCYNLAISKGHADEFIAFADWAKSQGIHPRTVIFEIDAISLMATKPSVTLPDFVVEKTAPPAAVVPYMSFHSLLFSVKTVFNIQSNPRYYDRNFQGAVVKTPPYDPTLDHSFMGSLGPYEPAGDIQAIKTFRANWPGVKVICYAAPFSPDFSAAIDKKGTLESFVGALIDVSKGCDKFRDFNIPSDLTKDWERTYDGIHYTPETNAQFANALIDDRVMPWSNVSGYSVSHYAKVYRDALKRIGMAEVSAPQARN
jgi:hypothetical protein